MNRKLVVGLATLIVLGGSAGAIAATQTGTGQLAPSSQAYIEDLAGRLNVAPSTLSAAMKAALDDRIDAALAAGRITPDRAAALKARVAAGRLLARARRPPAGAFAPERTPPRTTSGSARRHCEPTSPRARRSRRSPRRPPARRPTA